MKQRVHQTANQLICRIVELDGKYKTEKEKCPTKYATFDPNSPKRGQVLHHPGERKGHEQAKVKTVNAS